MIEMLKKGDVIGLSSPSHIADPTRYARVIAGIERLGFRVKTARNLYSAAYGYAATEAERATDIQELFADDAVKMVFFGGGTGGNEILPLLTYDLIARNPKILCSYSDGTSVLNAIHSRTGMTVYYGQAPGNFENLSHNDYTQFAAHFVDGPAAAHTPSGPWRTLRGGVCEGVLIGGYALNFALLMGGAYFSYDASKRYVLFLEDHEKFSEVNHVSALLAHIEQNPFIRHVGGLLFGHYSTEERPELYARLTRFGEEHAVPVAYCDDFGHGAHHAILPIGAKAAFDADKQTLTYL